MADRSIRVILRAEVAGYKAAMKEAADATRKVPEEGKKATTFMGSLVQSATQNEAAWTSTGRVLTGVGTAITGVGLAALGTGVAYNTLQQTSRAALTTLLGGAQAANAQMDKLDEFARSSPFSKAVFIQAQQQLLGFGMSAEKVLPTLDAIQNAVAATGGSANEISQITDIIAKIQSSAKITAVDLMRFGTYGVDAATMIGNAMGFTGAEIRDQITDGSIDAGAALDALAQGMSDRFGGAADGVKDTFVGAMDRVKAAWREFGAMLAEPLVSQSGGGLLVDFLNSTADAIRGFEALPGPAKAVAVSVAAITGAASLAAGAFLLLTPRIVATRRDISILAKDLPRVTSAMQTMGRIAGFAAAGLAAVAAAGALGKAIRGDVVPGVEATTAALLDMKTSMSGVDQMFSNLSWSDSKIDGFEGALRKLSDPNLNDRLANVGGSLANMFTLGAAGSANGSPQRDELLRQLENMGQGLADMAQSGHAEQASWLFDDLARSAAGAGWSAEQLLEVMGPYGTYLQTVSNDQVLAAATADDMSGSLNGTAEAAEAAAEALAEWRQQTFESSTAFIDPSSAYQAAIDKSMEWAQAQADATGDAKSSWQDFYDGVSVSMGQLLEQQQAQLDAQVNYNANMVRLAQAVSSEYLAYLEGLGPESAPLIAALANALPEELAASDAMYQQGLENGREYVSALEDAADGREVKVTIGADGSLAYEVAADTRAMIGQQDVDPWDLYVNPDAAIETAANSTIPLLSGMTVDPWDLGANPLPAMTEAEAAAYNIGATTIPTWVLQADGTYALVQADAASRTIGQKTPPPWDVDANTKPALGSADAAVNTINGKSANIKVGASESPGLWGSVQGLVDRISSRTATVQVAVGQGGSGGITRASGGSVFGPGTETSDSIPALLSNNEHVWTAKEVRGAGGHGMVERLRAAAAAGALPAFAKGGAVTKLRDQAQALRKEEQAEIAHAEWLKRVYGDTAGADAATARARGVAARAQAAEKALADEQARLARLEQSRQQLTRSTRRGEVVSQATSGLSGAYSVVNDLWDGAKNTDYSAAQRGALWQAAAKAEPAMKRLYTQADKVDASLKSARDRASELASISAGVSSRLSGEFSLEGATKQNTNSRGDIWYTTGSIGANAKATAARVQAFAGKLSRLQKMGLSGGVLQELAQMGSIEGSAAADALLAGGKGEIATTNKAFADIAKWSDQAGQYVTEGFYKGGLEAANGLVKGLESQQKAIEDQILKVAQGMEKALKKALGIKSPSRVTTSIGAFTGEGLIVGMKTKRRAIENEATAMGLAAIPGMPLGASAASLAAASPRYGSSSAPVVTVNATVDKGAMSDALNGVAMTLMVDGKPIKAIVHTELSESAASVSRGY